jgi:hypothetical protein
MFVNGSGWNEQSLQRTFQRCFLPSYDSFGQTVSEEKNYKNRPIRKKNRLWWPCLLMDWDKMSTLYWGPSIDASYQVPGHLGKGFQRTEVKCEKLTDAKWWQKLPLPLARWVKNLNDNQMTIYVPFPFNLLLVSEKKIFFIFPYGTMLNLQLFSYSWLIFHIQKVESSYTTLLKLIFPKGMKLFAKMFQFYCSNQLYWWRISEYPEKNTELLQVTISLHKVVPSTHRCVLEWYSMKYL